MLVSSAAAIQLSLNASPAVDVAPRTSNLRISRLPVLVIRPRRFLPPVEYCRGTRPSQAAKCRALLNMPISPTVAAISDALMGPIPGIVARGFILPRLNDDLRFDCLDACSSRTAVVEQSCEHMPRCLGECLIRVHKCCQFLQLADALWNSQAKLGRQATQGVR